MAAAHDEFIPTRHSLLQRLKNWEDQSSWRDFFDTYWKLIYSFARRAGLSEQEAQDIVQETVLAVARGIQKFDYDPSIGSFKSWLMQITRRRIGDQLRKRLYHAEGRAIPREQPLNTTVAEAQPAQTAHGLDRVWEEEWQRNLVESALEKVKARANAKQFQIFNLHVTKRLPARDVAQRLGVKLAEVYFAKYKISAMLRKQIKQLEQRGI